MSALLPSGSRAIAITIDNRGANTAGGFILPNDRVDVIRTFRDEAASKVQGTDVIVSETLLRNVRVLAIGQNIQERNGEKVVVGETATLELDPRQVEIDLARAAPRPALAVPAQPPGRQQARRADRRAARTRRSPSCATAPRRSADGIRHAGTNGHDHAQRRDVRTGSSGRRAAASQRLLVAPSRPARAGRRPVRDTDAASSVTQRDSGQRAPHRARHRQVGHRRPAARRQGSLRRQPEGRQRGRPLHPQDLRHRPGRRADQRRRAWTPRAGRSPTSTSTSAAT